MKSLKILIVIAIITFVFPSLYSDTLVWKNGAKMNIRNDYTLLSREGNVIIVTLITPENKDIKVYVDPSLINWDETDNFNEKMNYEYKSPRKPEAVAVAALDNYEKPMERTEAVKGTGKLAVVDQFASNEYGHTVVGAELRNETRSVIRNIYINIELFDQYENKVKEVRKTLGNINLQPGETESFDTLVINDVGVGTKITDYELKLNWD